MTQQPDHDLNCLVRFSLFCIHAVQETGVRPVIRFFVIPPIHEIYRLQAMTIFDWYMDSMWPAGKCILNVLLCCWRPALEVTNKWGWMSNNISWLTMGAYPCINPLQTIFQLHHHKTHQINKSTFWRCEIISYFYLY